MVANIRARSLRGDEQVLNTVNIHIILISRLIIPSEMHIYCIIVGVTYNRFSVRALGTDLTAASRVFREFRCFQAAFKINALRFGWP